MTWSTFSYNGLTLVQDSSAPGTPVRLADDDGGTVMLDSLTALALKAANFNELAEVTGNLIPNSDGTRELGSSTYGFASCYARKPVLGQASGSKAYLTGADAGFVGGYVKNEDTYSAQESSTISTVKGSFASGYVFAKSSNAAYTNDSKIIATYSGAFAHGHTYSYDDSSVSSTAYITAIEQGAFAQGSVYGKGGDSYITASGKGAFTQGYTYSYSTSYSTYLSGIIANGNGAFAQGYAITGGGAGDSRIIASGVGAFARGAAGLDTANSGIYATSNGASAGGSAKENSFIQASGEGGFAHGYCFSGGYITAKGNGSWAGGVGYEGTIEAWGNGSIAFGCLGATGGYIRTTQNHQGSMAIGYAGGGYSITAGNQAAFAFGRAYSYDILASGYGSLAIGHADSAAIEATANNSFQFGPGTNATANSLQIGGGVNLRAVGNMFLKETTELASIAGFGQLWCKDNGGTTELWFTNDAGADTQIV